MSLTENTGNMVMPVGPMGGYGGGYGGFGDSLFWIIVLFLFAFMGNGFGNGYGGGGTGADVQRGFDQQSVMNGIGGIQSGINSLAQGQCSGFAGVTAAVNNGFSAAEIAANGRQMANMQQNFTMQTGLSNQLNSIAMTQQQCCCENRAAVADLKYTVANEHAATRSNTDAKVQMVMDKLCQLEMDGMKQNYENRIASMQQNYQNQISDLQSQLNALRTDASQNAQTAAILRDNAAQTVALEQYLNPTPVPSYQVPNPNCCPNQNWSTGCGCVAA